MEKKVKVKNISDINIEAGMNLEKLLLRPGEEAWICQGFYQQLLLTYKYQIEVVETGTGLLDTKQNKPIKDGILELELI